MSDWALNRSLKMRCLFDARHCVYFRLKHALSGTEGAGAPMPHPLG